VAGKILPPLDVRSASSLKDLEKRIRAGPLTMILVYADWCGHCHHMMPHWDRAAKTPDRSVQVVKVNDTMLGQVNSTVNQSINRRAQPIEVEGYPSILLVDNQGNKVTDIEAVKDSVVLSKAMKESGPLAEEAGLSEAEDADLKEANVPKNSIRSIVPSFPRNVQESEAEEEVQEDIPVSPQRIEEEDATPSSLYASSPPTANERKAILVSNSLSMAPSNKIRGGGANGLTQSDIRIAPSGGGVSACAPPRSGGGLYGALSQSAYTLAAPALLLGMAGYVMKSKRRLTKKGRKSRRTTTRKGKGKGRGKLSRS
jgi:thiol-disulfide isomerase/thioredoxin